MPSPRSPRARRPAGALRRIEPPSRRRLRPCVLVRQPREELRNTAERTRGATVLSQLTRLQRPQPHEAAQSLHCKAHWGRTSRRNGARLDPASLFPRSTMSSVALWRENSASSSAALAGEPCGLEALPSSSCVQSGAG